MVVTTNANGDVCITRSKAIHVLVDLFAAFLPEADFHPVLAQRLVDSRYSRCAQRRPAAPRRSPGSSTSRVAPSPPAPC